MMTRVLLLLVGPGSLPATVMHAQPGRRSALLRWLCWTGAVRTSREPRDHGVNRLAGHSQESKAGMAPASKTS